MLSKSLIIICILLSGCMNIEIRKMGAAPNMGGAMLCYEELFNTDVSCHPLWYDSNLGGAD